MSVRACSLHGMDGSIDPAGLDPRLREVLDLERTSWVRDGVPKVAVLRERLGLSPARYHQLLNRAIDLPEALAYDPMLVLRLQRVRGARRQARSARRLGLGAEPG